MLRHFVLLYKNVNANSFQGFLVAGPFWRLLFTIDDTVPDIANVFQIWSTLAGYEEIAVLFEPITNVEITSMYNNEQLLDDVIVKVLVLLVFT